MKIYEWRKAVLHSDLMPTTRHVLLTLSCYFKDGQESVFPSTKTLALDTGLSERAVITHLHAAAFAGWIQIGKKGVSGQGWAKHSYSFAIPEGFVPVKRTEPDSAPSDGKALNVETEGTERPSKGTEPNDIKALNEVQSKVPIEVTKEVTKEERRRASRLPSDWQPSAEDLAYCRTKRPDLVVADVAEDFRDHWISAPDDRAKKTDWAATWRTWVRRQHQKTKPTAKPEKFNPLDYVNRNRKPDERIIDIDENGNPV
jgi:hypothetical protein